MNTKSRILLAAATLAVMGGAASANAQTLESVRVRLPNGQVLSLTGNDWQHDHRVSQYRRYYFEPRERVYVVYNEDEYKQKHNHGKKYGHNKDKNNYHDKRRD